MDLIQIKPLTTKHETQNTKHKAQTYIIAEIGINHNGSKENAFKLIDAAVEAGCNAAKFQLFSADALYPKSAGRLDWKDNHEQYDYDIYEAVKGFELPREWVGELLAYCNQRGVEFLSSVFDEKGLTFLIAHGIKKIKLSSYTITHLPLINACAKTGLPIIMSTGGATISETEEAVQTVLRYHDQLTLLHCNIVYPTPPDACHLGVMETLKLAFPGISTGYSDHTEDISQAAVQSIYLGGTVVEKHITLDKKMDGPDHFFALEPQELKQMVSDIRKAENVRDSGAYSIDRHIHGNTARTCYPEEKYLRDFAYMTLFANRKINKGDTISKDDIRILRPGKKTPGLEPKYLSLFEPRNVIARKTLEAEDPITWDAIL